MSKKSYMDHKNILSESFLSKLLRHLFGNLKDVQAVSKNKKIANDPKVKAAWAKVDKSSKDAREAMNAALIANGLEPMD